MDSSRVRESLKERQLDCPSLSLRDVTGGNIISQAALTQSVKQQRWKRTPDKHTHAHAQTPSVSRVFRYTLAGKQFHKLTYKVEKVRIDMNKQTFISGTLAASADFLIVSIISNVTKNRQRFIKHICFLGFFPPSYIYQLQHVYKCKQACSEGTCRI